VTVHYSKTNWKASSLWKSAKTWHATLLHMHLKAWTWQKHICTAPHLTLQIGDIKAEFTSRIISYLHGNLETNMKFNN